MKKKKKKKKKLNELSKKNKRQKEELSSMNRLELEFRFPTWYFRPWSRPRIAGNKKKKEELTKWGSTVILFTINQYKTGLDVGST